MPPSRNAAWECCVGVLHGLDVAAVFAGKMSLPEGSELLPWHEDHSGWAAGLLPALLSRAGRGRCDVSNDTMRQM